MDQNVFENPEEFRAERFLDTNGKFVKSYDVVPFGVGYRYCLGKTFAEMQFFIVLVTILQYFTVTHPSGKNIIQNEDVGMCGFTNMAPLDLQVKLVERKIKRLG